MFKNLKYKLLDYGFIFKNQNLIIGVIRPVSS